MPQAKKGSPDAGIPMLGRPAGSKRQRKPKYPAGTPDVTAPNRKAKPVASDAASRAQSSRRAPQAKERAAAKPKSAPARGKREGNGKETSNGKNDRPTSAQPMDETEAVGRQIHNEDFCGNCGIGGGLICCDRCPLAFHVLCCNPPLDPDNLPDGEWLCARCSPRERGPAFFDPDDIPLEYGSITDRFLRKNPSIFRPPREIIRPYENQATKEQRKRQFGSQMWTQDTLCYKCGQEPTETQRMRCTHCPSVFHVDCLEQPVTAVIVKGSWMCPNHAERIQARHKKSRLSMRETMNMDRELDDHVVKASFIRKVEQERAKTAGPAVPAAVTDADRHMFAEAVVRMHEDWWAQEAAPLRSQGARRAAPDMPITLALHKNVDAMSPDDRHAAILRLRQLVDTDRTDVRIARAQYAPTVRTARRAAAGTTFPKREYPDGCASVLRCSSTGELFFVLKGEDFIIGTGEKAKLDLLSTDTDEGQPSLNPPYEPDELHSILMYNKTSSELELVHVSESSIFLNGLEITNTDKKSAIVPDQSVLEICGLKFAVEHVGDRDAESPE
eukprot:m.102835 g.102835  ORF g.102835 m.102835 type:complete len:557 (+) comp12553_c0_seq1:100-1770(+)